MVHVFVLQCGKIQGSYTLGRLWIKCVNCESALELLFENILTLEAHAIVAHRESICNMFETITV